MYHVGMTTPIPDVLLNHRYATQQIEEYFGVKDLLIKYQLGIYWRQIGGNKIYYSSHKEMVRDCYAAIGVHLLEEYKPTSWCPGDKLAGFVKDGALYIFDSNMELESEKRITLEVVIDAEKSRLDARSILSHFENSRLIQPHLVSVCRTVPLSTMQECLLSMLEILAKQTQELFYRVVVDYSDSVTRSEMILMKGS